MTMREFFSIGWCATHLTEDDVHRDLTWKPDTLIRTSGMRERDMFMFESLYEYCCCRPGPMCVHKRREGDWSTSLVCVPKPPFHRDLQVKWGQTVPVKASTGTLKRRCARLFTVTPGFHLNLTTYDGKMVPCMHLPLTCLPMQRQSR